ncbi:hypothetical protein BGX26_003667 [Mortierella sp. AD094]|nr:hypothetical protein BGX26_003667 [Mortierella sp. AD094]
MAQNNLFGYPQALRPVYSGDGSATSAPLSGIVNVQTHYNSKTSESIVLWDEVLIAFKDASYVRHNGTMVSFLRDENFEVLNPIRFRANPDVVLEVVIKSSRSDSVESQKGKGLVNGYLATTTEFGDSANSSSISGCSGNGIMRSPQCRNGEAFKAGGPPSSSPSSAPTSPGAAIPVLILNPTSLAGDRNVVNQSLPLNDEGTGSSASVKVEIVTGQIDSDSTSTYEKGVSFFYGYNALPQNYSMALEKFHVAAAQNHVSAQYFLGVMYSGGKGVPQDYPRAMEWYLKATDQGDTSSQNNIGVFYYNGTGVPRDYSKAMAWFLRAANRGCAASQNWLGTMYCNGSGVLVDHEKAISWYLKAAERRNANAQTNLGAMYRDEKGFAGDYSKALEWFQKAAAQGHASSQNWLGTMYCNGNGVPRDYAKAIEWYEKAAIQGNASAQRNLEYLLREISKVPNTSAQNYDEPI